MRTKGKMSKVGSWATLLVLLYLSCGQADDTPPELDLSVVYAINAGGKEHTDKNGIFYESDPSQVGTASDYGNHLLIIGRVPEQDEVLYRTERYHTANFGYELPLDGDGQYALIMKFCEVYFNEPNMKVFDVTLNNQHLIVSELDIFHQVGRGTAHEEYAYFTVKDGRLYYKDEVSVVRNNRVRLEFIKGVYDNPKINAFVLMKGDVEHIPRLSPISDDILPMDADMAVFHDRVSADSSPPERRHAGSMVGSSHQGQGHTPNHQQQQQQQQQHQQQQQQQQQQKPSVNKPTAQQRSPPAGAAVDLDGDELPETGYLKERKTSGPRQPNPYVMDDTNIILPVIIAIGAFFPFVFCLCKL